MKWPARSPDLNPIENLWRIIKIRVSRRRHKIRNVEEMKEAIKEEWEQLTEEDFHKCIENMKNRNNMAWWLSYRPCNIENFVWCRKG